MDNKEKLLAAEIATVFREVGEQRGTRYVYHLKDSSLIGSVDVTPKYSPDAFVKGKRKIEEAMKRLQ